MEKKRILIAVKTYPVPSGKYMEIVCTAGFTEDGSWIRLYPSPFRSLKDEKRYKKYQWIELAIDKNPNDKRPESYRPRNIDDITLGDFIPPNKNWEERRKLIISKNKVHTNLKIICDGAKNNEYSLVIFKPKKIKKFIAEKVNKDLKLGKKEAIEVALKQYSLFQKSNERNFKLMPELPYKFSYRFIDDEGKESTLMIEDWEIGQLYWKCLERHKCEQIAVDKVKQKYFDDFALKKDIHLFLGTTQKWHEVASNPYVIIGVVPLPHITQHSLF